MKKTMFQFQVIASFAFCAAIHDSSRAAKACSIESGPQDARLPPSSDLTLGPMPTFLSYATPGPHLTRQGDDRPIPVVRVNSFDDVRFMTGGPVVAWRPSEPLLGGRYQFHGGLRPAGQLETFFVDPDYSVPVPAVQDANFRVRLDDPNEDEGQSCGGSDSSCDDIDFTQITVEFRAAETVAGALVEIAFPDHESRILVFSGAEPITPGPDKPELVTRTVRFFNDFSGLPASLKSERVCVAITPVSEAGSFGERMDLGCARPTASDPRVTDSRRGCAAAGTTDALWTAVALIVLAVRRERRIVGVQ